MKFKQISVIFINIIVLFFLIDLLTTNYLGIRNPSIFLESKNPIGHVNKPNFSGYFGGPLDNFYNMVNIDKDGLRKSFLCKNFPINTLFIGDSTTAGFEVNDNSTFVSLINKNCSKYKINGINAGVRMYDIHHVIAMYEEFSQPHQHKIVFYLVGLNKFNSKAYNTNPYYSNAVKRFGRAIIVDDEKAFFIEPTKNLLEKYYLNFRIFISDNFYFFTQFVRNMSFLKRKLKYVKKNHKNDNLIQVNSPEELSEFIQSIKILNNKVKKNNANLVIGMYPCLYTNCEERKFYEKGISSELKKYNIEVIQLVKIINEKSKLGLINKDAMRFPKDGHLSTIGHSIMSKEIGNFLKQMILK